MSTPDEQVTPKQADRTHPLFKIKKEEVSFEGEHYLLKSLNHRELMESLEEAKRWSREDPSIDERNASNYCTISRMTLSPHFSPQELREGDAGIVNFLNAETNRNLALAAPTQESREQAIRRAPGCRS